MLNNFDLWNLLRHQICIDIPGVREGLLRMAAAFRQFTQEQAHWRLWHSFKVSDRNSRQSNWGEVEKFYAQSESYDLKKLKNTQNVKPSVSKITNIHLWQYANYPWEIILYQMGKTSLILHTFEKQMYGIPCMNAGMHSWRPVSCMCVNCHQFTSNLL